MSRSNSVFQTLVTKGNAIVLAPGAALSTLAVGQIGFFDNGTNLSIDPAVGARDFYIAVGTDRNGDTVQDSIVTSAGSHIQTRNIRYFTFRPHTPSRPMIVEITDYIGKCDCDYIIKLEMRNSFGYRTIGAGQQSKLYSARTACCGMSCACVDGDSNEVTKLLVDVINADADRIVTAQAIALQEILIATHGTTADYAIGDVVPTSELDAIMIWNAAQPDDTTKVFTKIRLTTVEMALATYCCINTNFHKLRGTVIVTSLLGCFECDGKVTVTQELVYSEGTAYNIAHKEQEAGAWNGQPGPYRISSETGALPGFRGLTDSTKNYDQYILGYDEESAAGWWEHKNDLYTNIAVPSGDTVTRNAIAVFLDAFLAKAALNFDGLTGDAAAAVTNDATVELTTSKGYALDGIA